MIPKLKAELVTARNCVVKYKALAEKHEKLNDITGQALYLVLYDHALETQREYQTVLTELENQILV